MTIVLSGGGSGGHITPIIAVAEALKKHRPAVKIIYIGQKGDNFGDIVKSHSSIDDFYTVSAGKYRRFHGEGIIQSFNLKTFLLNSRDFIYVIIGIFQSRKIFKQIKADILFTRGGFVSVPVAIGAKLNNVPYITHDSDAVPSLANRIIARWAIKCFVAMRGAIYPYPLNKTVTTGVPINSRFKAVDKLQKQKFRRQLNLPQSAKVLFIIGGGLGSQIINNSIIRAVPKLFNDHKDLSVVHVAGQQNEVSVKEEYMDTLIPGDVPKVTVFGYLDDVYKYSGAADLVITRAGATNIAEFAAQGKACIIIPSNFLAQGHQIKNAQQLEEKRAVEVVPEESLLKNQQLLYRSINDLLNNQDKRSNLEKNISKFALPEAAENIAGLILSLAAAEINNAF